VPELSPLYTVAEAAAYLRVMPQTVYRHIARGLLAPVVLAPRKLAARAAALVGRRPRRDCGTASLTLWDVGGKAAHALRPYYDALPTLRPDLWPDDPPRSKNAPPMPAKGGGA